MQLDGRNIQLHNAHVLHDQGVDARVIKLADKFTGRLQLVVMQNGVKGDKHLRAEAMGERHQVCDVLETVAGVVAGTETGAADIDCICAVQNGFAGDGGIAGGTEQFKVMRLQAHNSSLSVI